MIIDYKNPDIKVGQSMDITFRDKTRVNLKKVDDDKFVLTYVFAKPIKYEDIGSLDAWRAKVETLIQGRGPVILITKSNDQKSEYKSMMEDYLNINN
jgi:hypothetical protein